MQLIPVVDLKGGCVVHARRGARESYRPIVTPLAQSAKPLDVVAGLLGLAPFRTLYIADLDAISGMGNHDAEVDGLRRAFPQLEVWVDAGEAAPAPVRRRAGADRGISVVGTESLADMAAARAVLAERPVILSLDTDASGRRGPPGLHDDATLWPERVIVMTLARVGSGEGPDLAALRRAGIVASAGGAPVAMYAAGGVRSADDLARLEQEGAAGVLVASALHEGRISPETARLRV